MLAGFREFIARGNAIDLAVGVIIGAAFKQIVDALVEKVLNPLIGAIFGKPNFDNALNLVIGDATVQFGAIITALVNFLLVALALYFCLVMPMNKMNEMREARRQAKAGTPQEEEVPVTELDLLKDIRNLLNKQAPTQA